MRRLTGLSSTTSTRPPSLAGFCTVFVAAEVGRVLPAARVAAWISTSRRHGRGRPLTKPWRRGGVEHRHVARAIGARDAQADEAFLSARSTTVAPASSR
jgi:hypothetical protein